MNKTILIGRLTADPDVRYSQGEKSTCIARFTLAVDRKYKKDGDTQTADFIRCLAFGKNGEFVEKYLRKGLKIGIEGRIQTGSYQDTDGKTVYTTDIVIESMEFCESKGSSSSNDVIGGAQPQPQTDANGFAPISGINESELPFLV